MREPWKITREMFLSVAEAEALMEHVRRRANEAVETDRDSAFVDRVLVESLLFSGLRNTEFCRLTLADVSLSLKERAFHVRGIPREDRDVVLSERLTALLRDYVSTVRPRFLRDGTSPRDGNAPFLVNERGNAYERTALYRRVIRILSAAGLESRASVQLLRHTYGYLAYLRTGGNLLFVQKQLGHAHPMVTSVYAEFVEFTPAMLANAVDPPSSCETSGRSHSSKTRAARR